MATNSWKYAPYIMATLGLSGIGIVAYFAVVDSVYKSESPLPEVDGDKLDAFTAWMQAWLATHGNDTVTTPPPSATTEMSVSSYSYQPAPRQEQSSFADTLSDLPVECWAIAAVGVMVVALCCWYAQQPKSSSACRRI